MVWRRNMFWTTVFPHGIIDPEAVNGLAKERVLDNGFPHGIIDPEAVNGLAKERVLDNGFPHGIIDPEAVNGLAKERVLDNGFPHGIIDPEQFVSTEAWNAETDKREHKLSGVGDEPQLANLEIQNILQKQSQSLQSMSNVSKTLHDTSMAIVRKIG